MLQRTNFEHVFDTYRGNNAMATPPRVTHNEPL